MHERKQWKVSPLLEESPIFFAGWQCSDASNTSNSRHDLSAFRTWTYRTFLASVRAGVVLLWKKNKSKDLSSLQLNTEDHVLGGVRSLDC